MAKLCGTSVQVPIDAMKKLSENGFVDTSDRHQGTVSVVEGTKLVYTAPPRMGMVISFK